MRWHVLPPVDSAGLGLKFWIMGFSAPRRPPQRIWMRRPWFASICWSRWRRSAHCWAWWPFNGQVPCQIWELEACYDNDLLIICLELSWICLEPYSSQNKISRQETPNSVEENVNWQEVFTEGPHSSVFERKSCTKRIPANLYCSGVPGAPHSTFIGGLQLFHPCVTPFSSVWLAPFTTHEPLSVSGRHERCCRRSCLWQLKIPWLRVGFLKGWKCLF